MVERARRPFDGAGRELSQRIQPFRLPGYGWQRLGMVPGLVRALLFRSPDPDEPNRCRFWSEPRVAQGLLVRQRSLDLPLRVSALRQSLYLVLLLRVSFLRAFPLILFPLPFFSSHASCVEFSARWFSTRSGEKLGLFRWPQNACYG